jgi:hypothetical protein
VIFGAWPLAVKLMRGVHGKEGTDRGEWKYAASLRLVPTYIRSFLGILKEAETGLLHMVVMTNSTAPQKYLVFLPQVCYDYFAAPSSVLT